jgi:hypothetical protein
MFLRAFLIDFLPDYILGGIVYTYINPPDIFAYNPKHNHQYTAYEKQNGHRRGISEQSIYADKLSYYRMSHHNKAQKGAEKSYKSRNPQRFYGKSRKPIHP